MSILIVEKGRASSISKEEKEVLPTQVFWDLESYPLPEEEECRVVVKNLSAAIRMNCSCRVIAKVAFGSARKLSLPVRRFLHTAMPLHVTGPGSHVDVIQHVLNDWANDVHAPANYVVVSNNKFLASTLDDLRSRNYNVLLAHPDGYPVDHALAETASCVFTFLLHSISRTKELTPPQKKEGPTPILVYKRKERQWDSSKANPTSVG